MRKGQVPVGKGELALSGGILVLTVRGKERLRAPVAAVQRTLAPMFADEGLRTGRHWLPRLRYRLKFDDKDTALRWGELLGGYASELKRATTVDRVADTTRAAESGVLRDRVWHRNAGAKEHGTLQLADGRLDFVSDSGETVGVPLSEIRKVGAPTWRSGRVTITTDDDRHVFGFDPRRLGDGTWEEGEIRRLDGEQAAATGLADANPSTDTYASSSQASIEANEFGNGLVLIGGLVLLAFEGNYTRRVRRRDWKRVLSDEQAAEALLNARAEKARAKLESDDLLASRF